MFKKGEINNPRGRPIGSPNKLTKAKELFEKLGLSPLEAACNELNKIKDPEARFKCYMELASYIYAKPRDKVEVDIQGLDQLVIIRSEKPKEAKIIDITPILPELAQEVTDDNQKTDPK